MYYMRRKTMTINELTNAQKEDHYECLNCGRTLSMASDDVEHCADCCDHDGETREELTGTYCLKCNNEI